MLVYQIPNTKYRKMEVRYESCDDQMDMQLGKPEANFEKAEKLVRMAAELKPDVITLPETWNTGFFPRENLKEVSDVNLEQTKKLFSRLAKEYRVNIIAGSVANCRDEKIYNTAAVFNRDGEVVMEYDKVHLFSPSGEHEYFEHGKNICNFELDGIPCSLVICYDIRFPELIRSEMLAGSKVQFVVAQWPDTRLLHWDTLNRARAIESQSFLCCTNSVGTAGNTKCGGHSAVYGPMGECLVLGGEAEQILMADMEIGAVDGVRDSINVYRDRLPEVYKI